MGDTITVNVQCEECANTLKVTEVYTVRSAVVVQAEPCSRCIENAKREQESRE